MKEYEQKKNLVLISVSLSKTVETISFFFIYFRLLYLSSNKFCQWTRKNIPILLPRFAS